MAPGEEAAQGFATTREAILHSAKQAFARHGYQGASLSGIATAAKTTHSLVIYHFKNKESLWNEVIDLIFGNLKERLQDIESLTKGVDSLSALKIFIRAFVEFSARYPDRVTLILNEIRGDSKRLEWALDNHVRPLHSTFDRLVARAVDEGTIKPIPPAHMAHILIGAASTFFVSRPVVQRVYGLDTLSPQTIKAHTDWVIEALTEGLARNPGNPPANE